MPEQPKTEFTFQEKGDKIVWKSDVPNIEMGSREVLVQINQIEKQLTNADLQMEKMKQQIELGKENIAENIKNLNKLKRFEEKMTKIQESKAKAIYEEIKDECRKKVDKEYKHDEGLTPTHNKHQKYCLLQKTIAPHKKAAEELAPTIITRLYFKDSIIRNPF